MNIPRMLSLISKGCGLVAIALLSSCYGGLRQIAHPRLHRLSRISVEICITNKIIGTFSRGVAQRNLPRVADVSAKRHHSLRNHRSPSTWIYRLCHRISEVDDCKSLLDMWRCVPRVFHDQTMGAAGRASFMTTEARAT